MARISTFISLGNHLKSFSTTPVLGKKGKDKRHNHPKINQAPDNSTTAPDDAFDFSGLEKQISKTIERLTSELAELKSGGRFNPKVRENRDVYVDKSTQETVKLRDVAQVVTKGRHINVILYDLNVSCGIIRFPDRTKMNLVV
jgi:ribosome recycling factor